MSWLARSLVNSLRGNDDNESQHDPSSIKEANTDGSGGQVHLDDEPSSPSRKVKEDISELTKTITRQFWGVASFLAPPPDISSDRSRLPDPADSVGSGASDEQDVVESPRITGIRSDFAELGSRFKSGISMLSNTKAVSEISKIASTFLPFPDDDAEEDEDEDGDPVGDAAGITEDVLLFVRNISMHPETWLDFPLIAEDEDSDDFKMSDAQQEHGLAVERLEPRLAALRIELCPTHMSEGSFWKIYFVLLHSRLNKHDAELLSTPQIVRARAMLLQDLRNRPKPIPKPIPQAPAWTSSSTKDDEGIDPALPGEGIVSIIPVSGVISSRSPPSTPPPAEEVSVPIPVTDVETEKHPVETAAVTIVDKSVIMENSPVQAKIEDLEANVSREQKYEDEDNEDDWLEEEEETGEAGGPGENVPPLGNDEDVSFSDLEEDDGHVVSKSTPTQVKESPGWVQLNSNSGGPAQSRNSAGSQNKDDWLNVDEVDAD